MSTLQCSNKGRANVSTIVSWLWSRIWSSFRIGQPIQILSCHVVSQDPVSLLLIGTNLAGGSCWTWRIFLSSKCLLMTSLLLSTSLSLNTEPAMVSCASSWRVEPRGVKSLCQASWEHSVPRQWNSRTVSWFLRESQSGSTSIVQCGMSCLDRECSESRYAFCT